MVHKQSGFTPSGYLNAKEYLDKRQELLARRHRLHLQAMTREVLASRLQAHWQRRFIWFKPAMAAAFASVAVLLLAPLMVAKLSVDTPHTQYAQSKPGDSMNLPEWVTDTDVPLTLIENLEFYDWLAKQPDSEQVQKKKTLTLAFYWRDQHRNFKRHTTSNLADRFSGAAKHSGANQ